VTIINLGSELNRDIDEVKGINWTWLSGGGGMTGAPFA